MHHLHSMLLGYIYQNFGMHDKHVPNIYSQTADDIFSHSLMKELNNMNKGISLVSCAMLDVGIEKCCFVM